jgi:hypothetical protein
MLIRISQHSAGIEHYFETGIKRGRDYSRDELDKRVHLTGSLAAFSSAVAYTTQNKKNWTSHYWHLTASFTFEDNDVNDETLRAITHDLLAYYYRSYQPDTLIVAAEAHRPKMQSEINQTTKALAQRLVHIHVAVSKLDLVTDNQIRMLPFNLDADKAFQSYLAAKHHLTDPADCKRTNTITKATLISRRHEKTESITKQTQVAELRKGLSQLLANVTSLDEAVGLLKQSDEVVQVKFMQRKSGNDYLQVNTTAGTCSINIRGQGFEQLERLYDRAGGQGASKKKRTMEQEENHDYENDQARYQAMYERHQVWWLEQQAKRKKAKPIDYVAVAKRYEQQFTQRLKEAHTYYILDQDQIEARPLYGYQIWEKNNRRFLSSNALEVRVYNLPDKIMLPRPDDPVERRNAVALVLEIAIAKGWDIDNLKIAGHDHFKYEVLTQINVSNRDGRRISPKVNIASGQTIPSAAVKRPRLNGIDQALDDHAQRKARLHSTEQIVLINTDLYAEAVLAYAVQHFGLISDHFGVTDDNKIADYRLKSSPRDNVDLLTKTCNMRFTDAIPLLNKLLDEQKETEKDKEKQNLLDDDDENLENNNARCFYEP